MDRKRLEELAKKYLSGTASDGEKQELHGWYEEDLNSLDEDIIIQVDESKEDVRTRILSRLKSEIRREKNKKLKYFSGYRAAIAVVAIVFVFIGIFVWENFNREEWILVETSYGELKEVALPDNSVVWVNAGSKFRYPKKFDRNRRVVELENGQAFFDVSRDEKKPFYVRTKDLEVTVLGTSFDVKEYEEEASAKVSVLSGKVDVAYRGENESETVKLIKGEQVVVDLNLQKMMKENASEEAIAAWKDKRLVFNDESIFEVMNALERRYNIEILGDMSAWSSETISIKLDNQPLDDVLEVLKYTMEFEYKKIEKGKIEIMK
ncbi:FecR family protein [Membranihabitans maritimus]|uniref:FecR family protein n=1 Tax=Membranihabitans maritimus TaxID=2904244 RepID=UPI001F4065DE|nr:FecR family protein [Membranihabitans maritimus]